MTLDLTPDELLTTTRAVRKRLDLDRPVEREVIRDCLDVAMQAPTGSNAQGWHWVVVTDPEKRAAIAEVYREGAKGYLIPADDSEPVDVDLSGDDEQSRVIGSARFLVDNLHRVPVHVIPCLWGRLPEARAEADGAAPALRGTALQAGFWGSIFPAIWSFQLALRARGLGSSLTTFHLAGERQVAELLEIPYERCTQAALLPVAYTIGTSFRPAARRDPDRVIHWDGW
jgi:nitroreductase